MLNRHCADAHHKVRQRIITVCAHHKHNRFFTGSLELAGLLVVYLAGVAHMKEFSRWLQLTAASDG